MKHMQDKKTIAKNPLTTALALRILIILLIFAAFVAYYTTGLNQILTFEYLKDQREALIETVNNNYILNNVLAQVRDACSETFVPLDFAQAPPSFNKATTANMELDKDQELSSNDKFILALESWLHQLIVTITQENRIFKYRELEAKQYAYSTPQDEQRLGHFSQQLPDQPLLSDYLKSQALFVSKMSEQKLRDQNHVPQIASIHSHRETPEGAEYFVIFKYVEPRWVAEEALRNSGYGVLVDEFDFMNEDKSDG